MGRGYDVRAAARSIFWAIVAFLAALALYLLTSPPRV